jgi:hypothetical protein
VVVQIDFRGTPKKKGRSWIVFHGERAEVCATYPGFEVDLFVEAEPRALIEWHLGRIEWGGCPPRRSDPGARTDVPRLLQPSEVADAVVGLVEEDTLAGRCLVMWCEKPPHLIDPARRE